MKLNKSLSLVCGLFVGSLVLSCKKETPPAPPPARPAPPAPPRPTEPPKKEPPKWTKDLPAKAVTAKVSDQVWATIPQDGSEMARFGLYKVDAVTGNTATLADGIGTKYPNVPGAVIRAAGDGSKVKVGDVVNGYAWAASKVVGVVTKLEAGKATLKYDWASKPKEQMMDHAEPLVAGVAAGAWVVYESTFGPYKGLCVALEGGKAWIHTDSGHVEVIDAAKVKPLVIAKDFKEGATVQAYAWGQGYKAATVTKVVEPGLIYSIKIAGKEDIKDYFFHNLAEKI